MRFLLITLLLSAGLQAEPSLGPFDGKIRINSVNEADALRMKVLQVLQVAQAPLHTKQDKATPAEVEAYSTAVKRVQEFKAWLVDDNSCAVSLRRDNLTSYSATVFSKAVWGIHDAQLKLEPPFTRSDIGVAVKIMNDAREILKLPVDISTSSLPERIR